jgi:arylsulfatase A-like enzyme
MTATAPNIVIFLADDLGFSDLGCYGGELSTPNLDALAESGTRLTQFYNTARCTPSRASLLTGLHPHQVGTGILTGDDGPVGYGGKLNHHGATLGEMLKPAGYDTAVIGKWHLTDDVWQVNDAWPTRRGFDYFYGTLTGCGSYFEPGTLTRNEQPIPDEARADDYYYTDAIAEEAVRYVSSPERTEHPFFLYVPFTAPHWPLHAPDEAVAKYAGRFDAGWDELRQERQGKQKELGILPEDAQLSPRDPDEPAWADVAEKDWYARRMEVYAAQVELMDDAIGRVLTALDAQGLTENTIVIFLSDNGASPEEVPHFGDFLQRPDIFSPTTKHGEPVALGSTPDITPGPATTYSSYGRAWANLSNTPFRLYKKWVHEGGIAAPFIFRWPARQQAEGVLARSPHQLTHVVPSLLDAAGVSYPDELDGNPILPLEGESFLDELLGSPTAVRDGHSGTTLYWEHAGNSAIRRGDMKLVRRWPGPWELYDLASDPTELDDILPQHRELAEELLVEWTAWAERSGVVPFDRIVQLFAIRGLTPDDAAR